jgi:acyl-CoA reductase-like NAD-dependent aldehyde dehydrogenase
MATTETSPGTETPEVSAAPETTASVAAVTTARAAFERGVTRPIEWRKRQLDALVHLLEEGEDRLLAALAVDVGKPSMEAWATDLGVTASTAFLATAPDVGTGTTAPQSAWDLDGIAQMYRDFVAAWEPTHAAL